MILIYEGSLIVYRGRSPRWKIQLGGIAKAIVATGVDEVERLSVGYYKCIRANAKLCLTTTFSPINTQ